MTWLPFIYIQFTYFQNGCHQLTLFVSPSQWGTLPPNMFWLTSLTGDVLGHHCDLTGRLGPAWAESAALAGGPEELPQFGRLPLSYSHVPLERQWEPITLFFLISFLSPQMVKYKTGLNLKPWCNFKMCQNWYFCYGMFSKFEASFSSTSQKFSQWKSAYCLGVSIRISRFLSDYLISCRLFQ